MNQDQEQKVLSTIYDRLVDAISYQPEGKPAAATKSAKLFMCKNFVLDPSDFTQAFSPLRPQGDRRMAEAFSAMVNDIPVADQSEFIISQKKVSDSYERIVNGANTDAQIDPAQQKTFDRAFQFLNQKKEVEDFSGNKSEIITPTPIAQAYEDNKTTYINAVQGYRTAYNNYDLTQVKDQRDWTAVEPGLKNQINQAWNKWVREGKNQVDEALNALQATINNAVSGAIAAAQARVAEANKLPSVTGLGEAWLPSYALPANWTDPGCQASKLVLKSSFLNKTASSEATAYSAGGHGSWGLWSFGGSYGHQDEKSKASMEASEFELSAELIQVRIMRQWLDLNLFTMKNWWVKGYGPGEVSANLMPFIPSSLIVARNVTIKAGFTEQDQEHFASQTQASTSVGWGPFAISGSYSHSESNDRFTSKFQGGALTLPGLQVIGIMCAATPSCPPLRAK